MRIVAGEFGGRQLRTPKGEATRPTSGMVRETLFNILADRIAGARVLDLFAGSGSVGLEALSRGAEQATLVEKARPALDALRANIAMLGVADHSVVMPVPVERALEQLAKTRFDIIFLDPPFADLPSYLTTLEKIGAGALLAPDGLLIAQHDARVALPDNVGGLTRIRLRKIGDNALSFYTKKSAGDAAERTMPPADH